MTNVHYAKVSAINKMTCNKEFNISNITKALYCSVFQNEDQQMTASGPALHIHF